MTKFVIYESLDETLIMTAKREKSVLESEFGTTDETYRDMSEFTRREVDDDFVQVVVQPAVARVR